MRIEGWERLLNEHIEAASEAEFAWGRHDCALWCAAWAKKVTGEDFGQLWRGKYKTENGAMRLMLKRGFHGPDEIADRHLETIAVPLARRGDLVLNTQGCLGICGGRLSFFATDKGVTKEETLTCARAWKIG